ncbi:RNA polymerase sigma factor [Adhaeribacter pallidiroseus]|uniref:ECF RNA polymerase sigma factor SigE n=1 Tax=Adhaeribacter pallidiroseus TaxID=2072847 RepID=A0A369QSL1_9BACT|nr:RNA polymerase sigma factor [Adhaeribacter pallidiroseus]RDC66207.1 ECF RNA polymerase sigma factor SigE [Adhaeribacter pallidiroseus]
MYSEAEIIAGCKKEKPAFQEKLFQLYSRRMMAICVRYTSSRPEAEDIFQEAFIKVFRQLKTYQGGSLEGWMRRIFVNTAINFYHSNRKYQDQLDYSSIEETLPAEDNVLDAISEQELLVLINLLPAGYKIIFNLYVLEGYSHQEISAMLRIAEATSRSQLTKAKVYLKKILQKYSITKSC